MCQSRKGADRDLCLFLWLVVMAIAFAMLLFLLLAGQP